MSERRLQSGRSSAHIDELGKALQAISRSRSTGNTYSRFAIVTELVFDESKDERGLADCALAKKNELELVECALRWSLSHLVDVYNSLARIRFSKRIKQERL